MGVIYVYCQIEFINTHNVGVHPGVEAILSCSYIANTVLALPHRLRVDKSQFAPVIKGIWQLSKWHPLALGKA